MKLASKVISLHEKLDIKSTAKEIAGDFASEVFDNDALDQASTSIIMVDKEGENPEAGSIAFSVRDWSEVVNLASEEVYSEDEIKKNLEPVAKELIGKLIRTQLKLKVAFAGRPEDDDENNVEVSFILKKYKYNKNKDSMDFEGQVHDVIDFL